MPTPLESRPSTMPRASPATWTEVCVCGALSFCVRVAVGCIGL